MSKHVGVNSHRLADNPVEAAFLKKWQEFQEQNNTLAFIMSGGANEPVNLSERDMQVAATVIQWLGSPVGRYFVDSTMAAACDRTT